MVHSRSEKKAEDGATHRSSRGAPAWPGELVIHAISVLATSAATAILLMSLYTLLREHPVSPAALSSGSPTTFRPLYIGLEGGLSLVFAPVTFLMMRFRARRPSTAWFSLMIASFPVAYALHAVGHAFQLNNNLLMFMVHKVVDISQDILVVLAARTWPRQIARSDFRLADVWWMRTPFLRSAATALLNGPWLWLLVGILSVSGTVFVGGVVGDTAYLLLFLPPLAILHISYVRGTAEVRRRVFWFLEVTLLMFLAFVTGILVRELLEVFHQGRFGPLVELLRHAVDCVVMVVCLVAGVFFVGAVSSAIVIRRTLVMGAAISTVLFAFVVAEEYGIQRFQRFTGVQGDIASALLCAACGAAFEPLRSRLNRFLKRRMPA